MPDYNFQIFIIVRGNTNRLFENLKQLFGEAEVDSIVKNTRVKIFQGDFLSEQFGLDDDQFKQISNEVDLVLHSAAIVKHYGNYQELYESNVLLTEKLIEFSQRGCKKHFVAISTASLNNPDFQKLENHYLQTKFLSEKKVLENKDNFLSIMIIRVGNLAFSSSGRLPLSHKENAFFQQAQFYHALGVMPPLPTSIISPVDETSRAVGLLLKTEAKFPDIVSIESSHKRKLSEELHITEVSAETFVQVLKEKMKLEGKIRDLIDQYLLHNHWLDGKVVAVSAESQICLENHPIVGFVLAQCKFSWSKDLRIPFSNLSKSIQEELKII